MASRVEEVDKYLNVLGFKIVCSMFTATFVRCRVFIVSSQKNYKDLSVCCSELCMLFANGQQPSSIFNAANTLTDDVYMNNDEDCRCALLITESSPVWRLRSVARSRAAVQNNHQG
jgi:hypothetical protein